MRREGFFKILDDQRVLRIMTRACRNLDEPQCLHLPAHGRLVQRDAEFLPYPLCEVLEAPAHHTMGRRDRPVLDEPCKRLALRVVELGRRARCLAVNQPLRPIGIETQLLIPDHLKPDTAHPRRIQARPAVINLRQRETAAALSRIFGRLGQSPQTRTIKITPQSNRCTHDEPPMLFATVIQSFAPLGIPHVSLKPRSVV